MGKAETINTRDFLLQQCEDAKLKLAFFDFQEMEIQRMEHASTQNEELQQLFEQSKPEAFELIRREIRKTRIKKDLIFLIDPNATWRYMNGRAEACYVNAMEGIYTQDTYDKNQLSAFLSPNSKLHDFVQGAIKALEGIGIEVGEPLQMTAYYVFQEDRPPVKYEPAFIEIAFERLIDEIRLIPWGQETRRKEITPKSYITMYIDAEGVSNILVPLVFETCKKSSPKEILSLDQAIEALNKHLESLIFPTFESKMIIDFIALEYIPFPATIDCLDINLKPVWSFYINYLRDEDRQVICIDAYTGEPVK